MPIALDHGEVYGSLTVLRRLKRKGKSARYVVGCACGYQGDSYRASQLMRADGVRECSRCRRAEQLCKPDEE